MGVAQFCHSENYQTINQGSVYEHHNYKYQTRFPNMKNNIGLGRAFPTGISNRRTKQIDTNRNGNRVRIFLYAVKLLSIRR